MYCGQSKPFEVQFLHVCFAFLVTLRFFFITAQFKQHFQFSFLSAFPEVFPVVCLSASSWGSTHVLVRLIVLFRLSQTGFFSKSYLFLSLISHGNEKRNVLLKEHPLSPSPGIESMTSVEVGYVPLPHGAMIISFQIPEWTTVFTRSGAETAPLRFQQQRVKKACSHAKKLSVVNVFKILQWVQRAENCLLWSEVRTRDSVTSKWSPRKF